MTLRAFIIILSGSLLAGFLIAACLLAHALRNLSQDQAQDMEILAAMLRHPAGKRRPDGPYQQPPAE